MLEKNGAEKDKDEDFENQVKAIHDQLYLFIYSLIHENELAKDALQNTLLTAYTHYGSLKDKTKFKSWIFTIGKREAIRLSTISKRYVPSAMDDYNVISIRNNDALPEDSILNCEMKEKIREAINSLKEELKEIVILKYYHDVSFEQIAKMKDINVNTVRSRHMRAKKRISEYLTNHYY